MCRRARRPAAHPRCVKRISATMRSAALPSSAVAVPQRVADPGALAVEADEPAPVAVLDRGHGLDLDGDAEQMGDPALDHAAEPGARLRIAADVHRPSRAHPNATSRSRRCRRPSRPSRRTPCGASMRRERRRMNVVLARVAAPRRLRHRPAAARRHAPSPAGCDRTVRPRAACRDRRSPPARCAGSDGRAATRRSAAGRRRPCAPAPHTPLQARAPRPAGRGKPP